MTRRKAGVRWMALAACCALVVAGRTMFQPRAAASQGDARTTEVVREIDDPHTGDRWLLERDAENPGGPGRLVLIERLERPDRAAGGSRQLKAETLPVIRLGDRVVIEEHTAVVDTRLTAVAMEPSLDGGVFHARLMVGGKVVRAVALGKGRAAFAPDEEQRP